MYSYNIFPMSYLVDKTAFHVSRSSPTLVKFFTDKGENFIVDDKDDMANSGVPEQEGIVKINGVLYGEENFIYLYNKGLL